MANGCLSSASCRTASGTISLPCPASSPAPSSSSSLPSREQRSQILRHKVKAERRLPSLQTLPSCSTSVCPSVSLWPSTPGCFSGSAEASSIQLYVCSDLTGEDPSVDKISVGDLWNVSGWGLTDGTVGPTHSVADTWWHRRGRSRVGSLSRLLERSNVSRRRYQRCQGSVHRDVSHRRARLHDIHVSGGETQGYFHRAHWHWVGPLRRRAEWCAIYLPLIVSAC